MDTRGDGDNRALSEQSITRRQAIQRGSILGVGIMASGALAACGSSGSSGSGFPSGPQGVNTIPSTPFQPSSEVGAKPSLPRVIGFGEPSAIEFWQTELGGVKEAAKDRNLKVIAADANGDPATNVQQLQQFLVRGVGALVAETVDVETQRAVKLKAIKAGVAVMGQQGAPSTMRAAADQYEIGHVQGVAAARWIQQNLGGKAQVVYFNRIDIPSVKPRRQGVLDALKAGGPGIRVIADQTTPKETTEEGFQFTNTILQAHPGANVFMGADSSMLGTLAALRSAGKLSDKIYISGVNGDNEALSEVLKGGPYKASLAFNFPVIGYAYGAYAADWLDGKQIPQAVFVKPITLDSRAAIAKFRSDITSAGLAESFKNGSYIRALGNVSYATRNHYLLKDF